MPDTRLSKLFRMDKMRKLLFALCVFYTLGVQAFADLPDEFYITQRWFSFTLSFDIETDDFTLGTVHRKFLSLKTEYDFYDENETLQAKAKIRWISLGAIFDITDAQDQPLGRVEEHLLSIFPTFDIISPQNEVLAIAKMNFWGTVYSLKDPQTNEEMVTMSRSFIRVKDNWVVKITNPELFASKQIDPRLFITLMAFQTDSDYWKKQQPKIAEALFSPLVKDIESLSREVASQAAYFPSSAPDERDFEAVTSRIDREVKSSDPQNYLEEIRALSQQPDLLPRERGALSQLLPRMRK